MLGSARRARLVPTSSTSECLVCVCVCEAVSLSIIGRSDLTVLSLVLENKGSSVCTMYSQPTRKHVPSGRSSREGQCLSTSPI